MTGYLKRLLSSLGAYQVSNVVARVIGVVLLPVYTGYIARSGYGTIELVANGVILISILTRFGMIESFLRFYYEDEDTARRNHLVRRTALFMLIATTVVAGLLLVFTGPLSRVALGRHDTRIFRVAVLGLWSFTNLEFAYSVLRVDERLRLYATASVVNVLVTVGSTLTLVVGLGLGAKGYLLGNYGASTLVLLGLWWTLRHRLRDGERVSGHSWRALMEFGLPTVPAEASVYLLSIVDRAYIYHDRSPGTAGLYALALKLAGAVSFIVTAFMYAWPPLAYSVRDDREAGRLYGLVATYYLLVTGWVVAALALEGRFIIHLLSHPAYYGAYRALPWGRPGLGAVRAVGDLPDHRRTGQGDTAQLPGRHPRSRRQRRAAARARAVARDRRRRDRAVRGVPGDARLHARADSPPVPRPVRMAAPRPADARARRAGRRRGPAAASRRRGGLPVAAAVW